MNNPWNLSLYNLIKYGQEVKTIKKLVNDLYDKDYTKEDLLNLGLDSSKLDSFLIESNSKKGSFLSTKALFHFDFDEYIIEIISKKIDNLIVLINENDKIKSLNLNNSSLLKLSNVLNLLSKSLNNEIALEYAVFEIISDSNEELSKTDILEILSNRFQQISGKQLFRVIEKLLSTGKIFYTVKGYKANLEEIQTFLSHKLSQGIVNEFYMYLDKDNLKNENSFKQESQFKKLILELPEFKDESKYYKILSEYDLSVSEMSEINFSNLILYNYTKFKYDFKPNKSFKDYIVNYAILNMDNLFFTRNFHVYNGEIFNNNILSLFRTFIELNKIYHFNFEKVKTFFRNFLDEYKFNFDLNSILLETLSSSTYLERVDSKNFIYLDVPLSDYASRLLLENIESISFLLNSKFLLISDKEIQEKFKDAYHVFSFVKSKYEFKFKSILRFDYPYIFNISDKFDSELRRIIEHLGKIDYSDFLEKISAIYSVSVSFIEELLQDKLKKHYSNNNVTTLSASIHFTDETIDNIIDYLAEKPSFSKRYLKNYLDKESLFVDDYDLVYLAKKCSFKYSDDGFFNAKYSSFEEAFFDSLKKFGAYLKENQLEELINLYETPRKFPKLELIPISENTYLVTDRILNKDSIIKFRDYLIKNIRDLGFVNLNVFVESKIFEDEIAKYDELNSLLKIHGKNIAKSLILSDINVYQLNKTSYKDIVRFGEQPSITSLIKHIVNKHKSIYRIDLYQFLLDNFDLEYEINNSVVKRLGFIYDDKLGKIYINSEQKKLELTEALKNANKTK